MLQRAAALTAKAAVLDLMPRGPFAVATVAVLVRVSVMHVEHPPFLSASTPSNPETNLGLSYPSQTRYSCTSGPVLICTFHTKSIM